MDKDWEARFHVEPYRISRWLPWVLFPFASIPFLLFAWAILEMIQSPWTRIGLLLGVHIVAVVAAPYFHRVELLKHCAVFFAIGACIGALCPLISWHSGWLVVLITAICPGLILTTWEVPVGFSAWGTAICYAILGACLFAIRRSA